MVGVYYPAYWECDEASVAAWRNEDPTNRAHAFIIPQNELTAGMEPMSNYTEDLKKYPNGIITKYDFATAQQWSWAVMPCRKFDDSAIASYDAGKSFRDLHIITLPEMFFVAAEAYYKLNDPKALARLNSVRKRAGLLMLPLLIWMLFSKNQLVKCMVTVIAEWTSAVWASS